MLNIKQIEKGIKYMIKNYGTKQKYIADALGVSTCFISLIANGKLNYNITDETLQKLSDFVEERINVDEIEVEE